MKINIWRNTFTFLTITIVSLMLGRIIEYLAHESGHFIAARLMGITFHSDPVQTLMTFPLLVRLSLSGMYGIYGFSESFTYSSYLSGIPSAAAGFIAIGGLIMNGLVASLCFWIFLKKKSLKSKTLMTVSFWTLIFNLGALFSYIPLQVFLTVNDVGIFLASFWIHPLNRHSPLLTGS